MFCETAADIEHRIVRADTGGFRNLHRQRFSRSIERIHAILPVAEIQVSTRFAYGVVATQSPIESAYPTQPGKQCQAQEG